MTPSVRALWLGRLAYSDALILQEKLVYQLLNVRKCSYEDGNTLLMLEHPPVYTVGLRSSFYSKQEEDALKALGADFHRHANLYQPPDNLPTLRTNRGGLITFHGPGQLVIYPILNLTSLHGRPSVGVRHYVHMIEKTIMKLLMNEFHLTGHTSRETGVWLNDNNANGELSKVAAIGINVKRGVTSHGLALNCCTDLSWFEKIVPCGLQGRKVTSLSSYLNIHVPIERVIEPFCRAFEHIFQCNVVDE